MKQPIQPVITDENGTLRFKPNAIVKYLLETSREGRKTDMNDLACMPFGQADREQFAQLIGYSLSGFGELSYVSIETYETAAGMAEGKTEEHARIDQLQGLVDETRKHLVHLVPQFFQIHPSDLKP